MPKENDLEGQQDMGGKHGGQNGTPRSAKNPRKEKPDAREKQADQEPRLE